MEHDLKRFPRLLARLLTGTSLLSTCSVQGCITVWTASHLGTLTFQEQEKLGYMVDLLARSSAQAQGLRVPITGLQKLQKASQTLYITSQRTTGDRVCLLGLLKTGHKTLYLRDSSAAYCTRHPLCVLDFFVLPRHQRQGIGRAMFEVFQALEGESPSSVAYDTPSPKLLAFLKKQYGLWEYLQQDNKFVVFPSFWDTYNPAHISHPQPLMSTQWTSIASRPLTPPRARSGMLHLARRPATAVSRLYDY